MAAFKFEQAKLKRLLSTYGIKYHFERLERNDFGEVATPRTVSKAFDIVGVYHEQSQRIQISVSNEVRYRTEKQPFILAEYESVSALEVDDVLLYNGVEYRVAGIHNVHNLNVYGDISLEVLDVGGKV